MLQQGEDMLDLLFSQSTNARLGIVSGMHVRLRRPSTISLGEIGLTAKLNPLAAWAIRALLSP